MVWQAAEIIPLLRWQRHDFLNHLQVISGYLQLKKNDRALAYLRQAIAQLEQVGRIMHLLEPELALAALTRIEGAIARGISLEMEISTRMENLALEPGTARAIWEAAWDLALALAGNGSTLRVELTCEEEGYQLLFYTPVPATLPAGAADTLVDLTRRQELPFTWQPETGKLSLIFKSR
ncbi:sensory histidine kinase DcuS [Moorella thermoacetica]|uniref:Sensory histidine kinase DcuS n=1 Tax=Neomoorella thermoacetica TaxID=1525 RepID=A0A1J5P869_NEOTH|nr:sensory histidine kinase DcuS [Moorella thermoacetica]